jgi:predicted flavoprotein YhiN
MKSKKVSNVYITGDLLDIRRPSGGFSLQLCWTTGYVAGIHCLQNKNAL